MVQLMSNRLYKRKLPPIGKSPDGHGPAPKTQPVAKGRGVFDYSTEQVLCMFSFCCMPRLGHSSCAVPFLAVGSCVSVCTILHYHWTAGPPLVALAAAEANRGETQSPEASSFAQETCRG